MRSILYFLAFCATLLLCITQVTSQNSTSEIDDNEMGMGTLFDMVNIFLGDVLQKKKLSESFLNLSALYVNGEFQEDQINDWRKWTEYLIGFAVCAAIGLVFIVIMPIIGIIFCCCRLCGRCGSKPDKSSSKRATCKRRTYCTILTILTTIALAGVTCAFICNSLIYKHIQDDDNGGTFGYIKQSLQQLKDFADTTVDGYSNYVTKQYDSTSETILKKVNDSAYKAVDDVLQRLHANELLASAKEISKEANETKKELDSVSGLLSELSNDSKALKDNLTDIKNIIEGVCNKNPPNTQACQGFDASNYNTDADFSSLDKLSSESNKVASALNMNQYVVEAEQSINDAKDKARGQVMDKTNDAEKAIKDVRDKINKGINDLQKQKRDALQDFPNIISKTDDADDKVKKNIDYAYYGVIGVCILYLIIIVLYYIGLLFGVCGEKPGDGAPTCNTGCGACFLITGVAVTFIVSWALMIVCTVLFCVGGPVYTEVCRHFQGHDPSQIKMFDDLINGAVDIKSFYTNPPPSISVADMIQQCQENRPLFSALQLNYVIDLDQSLNTSELKTKLDELKNSVINVDNVTVISNELNDSLSSLAESGLENVNFTSYFSELNKHLTIGNLSLLADAVDGFATKMNNQSDKTTLHDSATRLRNLNTNMLPQIKAKVDLLQSNLTSLKEKSKLKKSILELISDLTLAQNDFNSNKNQLIKEQITTLADEIFNYTTARIDSVKNDIREKLYGCEDVSTALFTMSDAVCLQIVEPLNGLWFSFGWCLFFFVLCLIFAVLLAGQYVRTLEDDKEFDDPNYLMYGGPNPDTIPLTSVDHSSGPGAYPRSGMSNAGYRGEHKRASNSSPPAYNEHMRAGTVDNAPAMNQHHIRAKAYQASYGDGYVTGNGSKSPYSYPY